MTDCLIGYDIGSSSIKAVLLNAETGICLAEAASPETEMPIDAPRPGWAEQHPGQWWQEVKRATQQLRAAVPFHDKEIKAIGITYQMHGLVCADKDGTVLRPAIIWCDSRAVETGEQAFQALGEDYCLKHYLNSPGNFTLSKLKWVKDHEPRVFEKTDKIMLPGDYIAWKLTGNINTTVGGLSEGIAWDFIQKEPAYKLLEQYGIPAGLLADRVPAFGFQGELSARAAAELHLSKGIPVTYRAGDQPNNAYALRVLNPGELAATAGTSGVVYGVTDRPARDDLSRINTFVHVNNNQELTRNGLLLCVNGTGISYSWAKKMLQVHSYAEMNALAEAVRPGESSPFFFPFGNGAERILQNRNPGAGMAGLDYNLHGRSHIVRGIMEGVAFSLRLGLEVLEQMMQLRVIKAGHANLFLSPLFGSMMADLTGASIEIYDTNGAQGAARAAGVGAGYYASYEESYTGLKKLLVLHPDAENAAVYRESYQSWKRLLRQYLV